MERFVKIDGHDSLVRDTATMGIINTDTGAYEAALNRKKYHKSQQDRMSQLENDIFEIKKMFAELLTRVK